VQPGRPGAPIFQESSPGDGSNSKETAPAGDWLRPLSGILGGRFGLPRLQNSGPRRLFLCKLCHFSRKGFPGIGTGRLSDELVATVDAWASRQSDKPTRSEAIRRLVEIGLKAKKG
jgi:hypothetical protein